MSFLFSPGGVTDGDKGEVVVTSGVWALDTTGTKDGSKFLRDDFQWTAIPGGGDMLAANNLSDLTDDAAARTNLGLGALAVEDEAYLTTAAIGSQTESTIDVMYRDTSTGRRYVTTAVDTFAEIFVAGVSTIAASDVSSGTFADARISQSSVTQHEAALTILPSQITALQDEKGITIPNPTNSEDISLFFMNRAITITEMRAVVRGTTPSVTWTIRHASDRSAAGTEVVTGGTTTTSETSGSDVTVFNDATIPADSFTWFETSATSGTVDEIHLTITYTID